MNQREPALVEEVVRKLSQLNPSLKGEQSTSEFALNAQGVMQRSARPAPQAQRAVATDADALLSELARERDAEQRALEAELSLVQARLRRLNPRYLERAIDALGALDPNLSSPVTQEALRLHSPLLGMLGFSVGLFIARRRGQRTSAPR